LPKYVTLVYFIFFFFLFVFRLFWSMSVRNLVATFEVASMADQQQQRQQQQQQQQQQQYLGQPRKASSNSSHSALSHVDIGQHLHTLSVPSLAATLSLPQHSSFSPHTPRRLDFATGIGGSRQVSQSTTSNATSSPSSAERERALRLQQRRRQGKRRESAQGQGSGPGLLYTQISTPPPRRSSKRKSRFVGFDGIYTPKDMTEEALHNMTEVSGPPIISRLRSVDHTEGIFTHGRSGENIAELSVPPPVDRNAPRRPLVEEAREQAQQIRNSTRNSHRHDSSFMRPEYSTPLKKYHDDGDELTLGAAPPPSVSASSQQRLRMNETLIPPVIRSYSRIDHVVPGPKQYNDFATQLYITSYLIIFAILGTLARLGLEWLNFYPGTPVNIPVLWANFAGCLIIGFLLEDRNLFIEGWGNGIGSPGQASSLEKAYEQHLKVKKTLPLYIGLATGFCGSLTSFSTFMEDAFLAMANDLPVPQSHPYPTGFEVPKPSMTIARSAGFSILALLGVILLTVIVAISAVKAGAHLAIFCDPYMPTIPFHFTRKYIDKAVVPIAWLAWLGALIMAVVPPDRPGGPAAGSKTLWEEENWRPTILACLFAPLGCLLRFYLAVRLNGMVGSFPLGTFAANIFGTAALGMAFDLNRVAMGQGSNAGVGGGLVGCQVLIGVSDGFCGCLTTVSTWAAEIVSLGRRAYLYGAVTVATALALLIVIMGSVRWSVGWQEPVCS
jgi:CrcB protein